MEHATLKRYWIQGARQSCRTLLFLLVMVLWQAPTSLAQETLRAKGETMEVGVASFGLGNSAREGSWIGVRVAIRSYETVARRIEVVWELPDSDGDTQEVIGQMTANPGRRDESVWLYARLPFRSSANSIWTINVYPVNEDGNRQGKPIGKLRFQPTSLMPSNESFIGVVGNQDCGLRGYTFRDTNGGGTPYTTNERLHILTGLRTSELPTRWMGYDALECLIINGEGTFSPTFEQADAIREWVYRGGHLVVVLPALAESWNISLLDDIIPEVQILTLEDQELRDGQSSGGAVRYLMPGSRVGGSGSVRYRWDVPRDPSGISSRRPFPVVTLHALRSVHENGWTATKTLPLMPLDASFAETIMRDHRGVSDSSEMLSYSAQRHHGFGFVTLTGMPVYDLQLARADLDYPVAEVFWNHILGRRNDTPSGVEKADLRALRNSNRDNVVGRSAKVVGKSIGNASLFTIKTRGTTGLLLALLLFSVYWIVSGPLAFAILKNRGMVRHSWVAFSVAGMVFAVIGWLGVSTLRVSNIQPRHFTVVDHVYGEDYQRSFSMISTVMEGYGQQEVFVGATDREAGSDFHNAISPFSNPNGVGERFPDPRSYRYPSNNPDSINFPARATAKEFLIDSIHPPAAGWSMPTFKQEQDRPRLVHTAQGPVLTGILEHDLPNDLEETTVIVVTNNQWLGFGKRNNFGSTTSEVLKQSATPRLQVYTFVLPNGGRWAPNEPLDLLAKLVMTGAKRQPSFWNLAKNGGRSQEWNRAFAKSATENIFASSGTGNKGFGSTKSEVDEDISMLSVFRQLNPPVWYDPNTDKKSYRYARRLGRELDLSNWLNRPCVIIIGRLSERTSTPMALPIPIEIDGQRIEQTSSESSVYVRWIYPLDNSDLLQSPPSN